MGILQWSNAHETIPSDTGQEIVQGAIALDKSKLRRIVGEIFMMTWVGKRTIRSVFRGR